MERRGETWRKTQKGRESCVAIQRLIMDFSSEVASVRAFTHPLGSWHSGINAPSQGSGANAAPSGTYASGPQWVLLRELWRPGPTPLPKDPGVWVRTPAPSPADGPSLGAGLRAPPLAAVATAALPSEAGELHHPARAQRREGKGGSARELLGPASFPSPPPTPGRWGRQFACAVAARGGGCGGDGVGGCARPASWRAGAELTGRRTGAKCPAACGAYGG